MSNINLDVRVYPLDDPQGVTKAFANVGIEGLVAINGIRVVEGANGLFVSMPQTKDSNDNYHDVAFPINSDLRKELNKAVLGQYKEAVKERSQSLGDQLRDGQHQVQQRKQEAAAQPKKQQTAAKKAPGLGD